ncbi:MAG: hypothetical protein RIB43_15060 [Rhodospirillaceae bacterium]
MTVSISKFIFALTFAALLSTTFSVTSHAQDPRRGYGVGIAGQGTDMITQAMSGLRLFTPHRDNCNATTEVFVKVYTNSNSVDFGFCIDKNEHPDGTVTWQPARRACLDNGKRLPEPGEVLLALNTVALSLNNTGEDYEWSSNFFSTGNTGSGSNIHVPAIQSQTNAGYGYLGTASGAPTSLPFRCVR